MLKSSCFVNKFEKSDKKVLLFLYQSRNKNIIEQKQSIYNNKIYPYLHPKSNTFFHIISSDSFPTQLNLKSVPARFEKLFVSTNKGVAIITPVNLKNYVIDLSGKDFNEIFHLKTENFEIQYYSWSDCQ